MMTKTILMSACAAVALAAAMTSAPAQADDCLLDTNADSKANDGVDTDGGANSSGIDARHACGFAAEASGTNSTAATSRKAG